MDKLAARKPRKSAPKSRLGCFTCKARHIRCDQQRPSCENCASSGRPCEGYPELVAAAASKTATTPYDPGSIAAYSIPFKIPGSQSDRQLLHYYCCQAAWNLSSYADPVLWTELILQRAHDQPVVRNALVALSSLHKDFVCGSNLGLKGGRPSSNLESMAMISKCYGQLSNYLARSDASADVGLICSVIFYALESLLGDSRQAISHLDSGLKLLKRTQGDPKWASDPLFGHLTRLLQRLDVQASGYDDERVPVLDLVSVDETLGRQEVVPGSFDNLDAAEENLAKLQNWTLRHLITNLEYKGKPIERLPPQLLREKLALRQQFDKYRHALTELGSVLESRSEGERDKDHALLRSARFLLLRCLFHVFYHLVEENVPNSLVEAVRMSDIFLPSGTYDGPSCGNDIASALADMLQLFSLPRMSVAQASNATYPSASPSDRTCTLSTFLVAALYFLCLKTTSPELLTTASALLAHPLLKNSRDGLWDARLVESVVEGVKAIRDRSTHVSDVAVEDGLGGVPSPSSNDLVAAGNEVDHFNAWFSTDVHSSMMPPAGIAEHDSSWSAFEPSLPLQNGTRLEDYAWGIVDVTGGVEEAARRAALICK